MKLSTQTMRTILPVLVSGFALCTVCGCEQNSRLPPVQKQPILIDELDIILPTSIPTPRSGETVYRHTCGYCHDHGVGPSILGRQLHSDTTAFMVRNGFRSMPAFKPTEINASELKLVATYVQGSASEPETETDND